MRQSLLQLCRGEVAIAERADLAYAALVSGITLANAGLGLVHGFASVIGGLAAIPHGVVCGTLMAAANEITLRELRRSTVEREALAKYARLGQLFSDKKGAGPEYYQDAFIDTLDRITAELEIDLLSDYGITGAAVADIAGDSSCKNNPAVLGLAERQEILLKRIA
jgi:alcohol dehydrogenase class IV